MAGKFLGDEIFTRHDAHWQPMAMYNMPCKTVKGDLKTYDNGRLLVWRRGPHDSPQYKLAPEGRLDRMRSAAPDDFFDLLLRRRLDEYTVLRTESYGEETLFEIINRRRSEDVAIMAARLLTFYVEYTVSEDSLWQIYQPLLYGDQIRMDIKATEEVDISICIGAGFWYVNAPRKGFFTEGMCRDLNDKLTSTLSQYLDKRTMESLQIRRGNKKLHIQHDGYVQGALLSVVLEFLQPLLRAKDYKPQYVASEDTYEDLFPSS